MARPIGTANGEGVAGKVLEFFRNNPDEELTYADLIAKFGGSYSNAQQIVNRLARRGELESVHVIRLRERGRA